LHNIAKEMIFIFPNLERCRYAVPARSITKSTGLR